MYSVRPHYHGTERPASRDNARSMRLISSPMRHLAGSAIKEPAQSIRRRRLLALAASYLPSGSREIAGLLAEGDALRLGTNAGIDAVGDLVDARGLGHSTEITVFGAEIKVA